MKPPFSKYLLLVLMLWLFKANLYSQQPHLVQVSGYVYQKDSSNVIPFVDIVNKKNKTGTISTITGFFSTLMAVNDTLEFTAIGYKKFRFWLPANFTGNQYTVNIWLEKVIYTLDQVDIGIFNYERFKKDFESMKIPVDNNGLIAGDPTFYRRYTAPKENFGYTIKGPFTALYNKFNRRAKELEKLQEILANQNKDAAANAKLTKELVQQVTGIEEKEIDRLLAYCNMGSEFIANATTYDLMVAIDRCYKSYLEDKNNKQ